MTVEMDRDALVTALRQVSDVVEARNTIPILSNLLLEAGDGRVTLTGTDLDVQVRTHFDATGVLATTVAAAKMLAAAQSFKPGQIRVEANDQGTAVTMRQARSVRTIPTLPATDFPLVKSVDDSVCFDIAGKVLVRLLDATHVAMSTEEIRFYLNGVYLHVAGDHLRAAATDGHRLVRADAALPAGAAGMRGIIVGRKTVTLLRKLLAKADSNVRVEISKDRIAATIGTVRVDAKLIDGTFPDYSRVIPTCDAGHLTIGRAVLVDGVGAVAAIVNAEGEKIKVRSIRLDLGGGEEQSLFAQDATGTNATESIAGQWSGEAMTIGANSRYLADIANIFGEAAVLDLAITTAGSPIKFTSEADPDLVAVCMPMRV